MASRLRVFVCVDGGPFTRGDEGCPNVAAHTPHPVGYVSHSNWADDALLVADQKECHGGRRWAIWVPKRPDLRIAKDWPPAPCDWGGCDAEDVAERFDPTLREWLPVCVQHTGVEVSR